MKYSWFAFALIQKVESFQSQSSAYMKHMEIAPAALPEGLMLTFLGVINNFCIFSFISIEKRDLVSTLRVQSLCLEQASL